MRISFFVLLVITAMSLTAQQTLTTAEDFNQDGIVDQLNCTYTIGSSFGGTTCKLQDGKTKKTFTLSNYGCYCAIKKSVFVTPELRKKENEYFLYTLKKEVLPEVKAIPDQSLYWIIKSGLHSKKLTDHRYFNLIFQPNSTWRSGKPEPPYTYAIEINSATLSQIAAANKTATNDISSADHKDFLVYYGDTHFSNENKETQAFQHVATNNNYEIMKTAHGVIAKKGDTYKWLFVTDIDINAAPQKLRWSSIKAVVLLENHVLIQQSTAPNEEFMVYLIAIESGTGGRIKIDFNQLSDHNIMLANLNAEQRFSVQKNTLSIGTGPHKIQFPLSELKLMLNDYDKGK